MEEAQLASTEMNDEDEEDKKAIYEAILYDELVYQGIEYNRTEILYEQMEAIGSQSVWPRTSMAGEM